MTFSIQFIYFNRIKIYKLDLYFFIYIQILNKFNILWILFIYKLYFLGFFLILILWFLTWIYFYSSKQTLFTVIFCLIAKELFKQSCSTPIICKYKFFKDFLTFSNLDRVSFIYSYSNSNFFVSVLITMKAEHCFYLILFTYVNIWFVL